MSKKETISIGEWVPVTKDCSVSIFVHGQLTDAGVDKLIEYLELIKPSFSIGKPKKRQPKIAPLKNPSPEESMAKLIKTTIEEEESESGNFYVYRDAKSFLVCSEFDESREGFLGTYTKSTPEGHILDDLMVDKLGILVS